MLGRRLRRRPNNKPEWAQVLLPDTIKPQSTEVKAMTKTDEAPHKDDPSPHKDDPSPSCNPGQAGGQTDRRSTSALLPVTHQK